MELLESSPTTLPDYASQRNRHDPDRDQNKIATLVSSVELLEILDGSPGSDYVSMDPSYITHQRRPALIPANAELSPEDEISVRLRTGCVDPTKIDQMYRGDMSLSKPADMPTRQTSKRKASILEREQNDKEAA